MGDPVSSKDWEIEEPRPVDSLPMSSKASWVFNTGLQLGRNIMIITLFASSVPIVLPPLLIISALGFAFSVPFGVIFASYTCTEKIMSNLLPLPGPHPPLILDSVIEAEDQEPSARDDNIWISDEEKEDMGEYLEGEDDVAVEEEVHPLLVVSAVGGQLSVGEGDKNIKEDDFSRETINLLERFRDVPKKPVTEMNETDSRVDEKENDSNKQPNGNRPETVGFGSVDVVSHKDSVKDVNGSPEATADEKPETKLVRIDTQVSSKDVTTEEQQEEEKIRKQMNALREIIGYKGISGSCVDELKALFVFTGVEPPASFKGQSPLAFASVNDSLQFLKSVVGVK